MGLMINDMFIEVNILCKLRIFHVIVCEASYHLGSEIIVQNVEKQGDVEWLASLGS